MSQSSQQIFFSVYMIVYFAIIILLIVAMWKVYAKAGKPGWGIFIPIYNAYLLIKIVGRPGWWTLLLFVPLINLIVSIVVSIDLAKAFGKSTIFGIIALLLFPFVGYPMLAFSKAQYKTPEETPLQNSPTMMQPAQQTATPVTQSTPEQPTPPQTTSTPPVSQ